MSQRTTTGVPRALVGVVLLGALLLGGTGIAAAAPAAPVAAQSSTPSTPSSPDEFGVGPDAAPDPRDAGQFASPEVATLQGSASSVQRELTQLQGDVLSAQQADAQAREALGQADATLGDAQNGVASDQVAVDEYTRSIWTDLGPPSAAKVLLTAKSPQAVVDGLDLVASVRAQQNDLLGQALGVRQQAQQARDDAAQRASTAAAAAAELTRRETDARGRASALSADLGRALSTVDAQVVALQKSQQERNAATAANWQSYLDTLARSSIVAPDAAALRDPSALPAGLSAVAGADGAPQAGVARARGPNGTTVLVLSAQAQRAVTEAIATLGRPYSPTGTGPRSYSCGALVVGTYAAAGLTLPGSPAEQLATGVPVALADTQPGDLLFVGPAQDGVQAVDYVLDQKTVLTADARATAVVVADRPADDQVLGAVRPALGSRPAVPVPTAASGRAERSCGGIVSKPSVTGSLAWGGYPNGLIPPAALCSLGVGSHRLRCDAAQAYTDMSTAYAQAFGGALCITDSYRPYSEQVDLYGRKPALAAVPGTSNHGWGMAVDLCGGIESYSSAQYAWMTANAGAFGWVHPSWARQGGGREEPWHWEFNGG